MNAFGQQRLGALEIDTRDVAAGAGRVESGLGAAFRKLKIGIVEPGDDLADVEAVADVDAALDDLAGDTETDRTLDSRPHHARVGQDAPG